MVRIEQHTQAMQPQVVADERKVPWLTADDIDQKWTLRTTRNGAVLIPGQFNWKHHSMALGVAWRLPDGVRPAWSNQCDGLGDDYVGPVLVSRDPALLEDIMKHPPKRRSVQQLMSRTGRNGH